MTEKSMKPAVNTIKGRANTSFARPFAYTFDACRLAQAVFSLEGSTSPFVSDQQQLGCSF